jgi:hypothetical protein
MAYTYAVSEFTDLKGETWKVKIIDTASGTDLNHAFVLGPNGFKLDYSYDNFDRAKAILGSKVNITLFHPDDNDTAFNTLYDKLNSEAEGSLRLEIYRDPDSDNELWWRGEILAEQTVIPDEYPHAAVMLTAVDGLGNLKGINYTDHGVAYEGTATVLEHLFNILKNTHCYDSFSASDVFIRFYEDFEASNLLSVYNGKQLKYARVSHNSFYNTSDNNSNEYYSCYEVLESFAITFNCTVFMAKGSFWFVPLGTMQKNPLNDTLDTYYTILANGTESYSGVALADVDVEFGNNNSEYEKLAGWERASVPAFKKATRTRDYQGTSFFLGDSNYSTENLVLTDDDINYLQGDKFRVTGEIHISKEPDGPGSFPYIADFKRPQRLQVDFEMKVGDGGGTAKYLDQEVAYSDSFDQTVGFYNYSYATWPLIPTNPFENMDYILVKSPYYPGWNWSTAAATRDYTTGCWDAVDGTNVYMGMGNMPFVEEFQFTTPGLEADASGLTLSASWKIVDREGNTYTTSIGPTSTPDVVIKNLRVYKYVPGSLPNNDQQDHYALNPGTARYEFSQGTTLIGDEVSDLGLGNILIYEDAIAGWTKADNWESSLSTTPDLSINALGIRERLAANLTAARSERGTLAKVGTKYIHPFTQLINTYDSNAAYQVTGLTHIAASCEYDIECMYLQRDITGITVAIDNEVNKGPKPPTPVPTGKSYDSNSTLKLAQSSFEKSESLTTDDYGLTDLKISNGSSGTWDLGIPTAPPTTGQTSMVALRSDGNFVFIANGTTGQVLTVNAAATGALFQDAPGAGWLGSTTRIKVLARDFVANDAGRPLMIEDDSIGSNELFLTSYSSSDMFAYLPIPTGYKATHVKIFGSDTSQNFYVYEGDIDSKTIVEKGAATSIGTEKDITDVTSDTTNYLIIRVTSDGSTDEIYGGYITIAAT